MAIQNDDREIDNIQQVQHCCRFGWGNGYDTLLLCYKILAYMSIHKITTAQPYNVILVAS